MVKCKFGASDLALGPRPTFKTFCTKVSKNRTIRELDYFIPFEYRIKIMNIYLEHSSKGSLSNVSQVNDVISWELQCFQSWIELSSCLVVGHVFWQLV